jgi:DNA mismatch endonuclease (patch repair protein)
VFTRQKIAVFVDGCFWHRCPQHGTEPRFNSGYWSRKLDRNVERDREVDTALKQSGWKTVRIWEHEDVAKASDQIASEIHGRKRSRADTPEQS